LVTLLAVTPVRARCFRDAGISATALEL